MFDELKYKKIRIHAVSGSFVLWRGDYLISRVIRLWTPYNHASLVIRLPEFLGLKDRVFLVEALRDGLQLRLLSERLQEYKGHAYLFVPKTLTLKQQECIRTLAIYKCAHNVKYDYEGLFKNALGRVSMNAHKLFCSEWVHYDLRNCRVSCKATTNKAPRPGDLAKWYDCNSWQLM